MSKALFAMALVALVGAAAAVEADTASKKHYKPEAYEYKEGHGHVKHIEFDVAEVAGSAYTYPSSPDFQIVGSTVAYTADLEYDGKPVGSAAWSGIVVKSKGSADCEEYSKKHHPHVVKINYQITLEFTVAEYAGQIVGACKSNSVYSPIAPTCAVLGGTGAFAGASGTFNWVYGNPTKYVLDLWIPKAHEGEEYEGKEHYSYYGKKY